MRTITAGVDLAKCVFSICKIDAFPGYGSAPSIQQDRLQKCSLTPSHRTSPTKEVCRKKGNQLTSNGRTAQGQGVVRLGLTEVSLRNC